MEKEQQLKDLIMGMVMNYDWNMIEPFFVSLRRSGFSGDVVIFVSNIADTVSQKLQEYNVTIIPFQRVGLEQIISPNDYRYYLYLIYLQRNKAKYRFVLLTDVRDVIFQAVPFSWFLPPDKISVAVESRHKAIWDDVCNTRWILTKFGTHIFHDICGYPSICSGTTIAPVNLMCSYLDKMFSCIFLHGGYYQLIDQGVHNYLLYTNQAGPAAFLDNNSGVFLTLGLEELDQIMISPQGKITTNSNPVAAIVHQYDRHKNLLEFVNRTYREQ
ncbi:hypothetical protein SDC9_13773 [bioreactor metagenome]|uniref:Uncharacterized protein n=1 Tax=bioreactor metagenome TaxID=1076179 RepID=A0A644TMC7_9ZZZZ|nr:hypothetical protein [Negativicutes bacterium]